MPDYKNGKIYAIRSYMTDQIYIGSTCQTLARRMSKHKMYKKEGTSVASIQIIDHGDAYIELIELFPCDSREQLNAREAQLIKINNCTNKRSSVFDVEKDKKRKKDWYEANKEQILKKMKEKYYSVPINPASVSET